jgi:hypothetical protein
MRFLTARLLAPAVLATGALVASSVPAATAGPDASRASATQATQATTATTATTGPRLRVGTYNFEVFQPMRVFKPAMKRFKYQVDVAGLQEMGMKARSQWMLRDHTWGYYRPPALGQNPIIWRRSVFDFVSATGIKIAEQRNLGTEHGIGPETHAPTLATVVRLRDIATGQQISFINTHLVHGAIKRDHRYPGRPRTYALYLEQLAGLIDVIKSEQASTANTGGVYVTGDFNISYRMDVLSKRWNLPFASMLRVGMHSLWQRSWELAHHRGTHGPALIDEVWNTSLPLTQQILRRIKGSDHYAAVATYALPSPAPDYAPPVGAAGFVQQPVEGAEYWSKAFMKFPITGTLDIGWVNVRQVPETGANVAQLGTDFVIDDSSLQPGSSYILVRALADGNLHERPLEHFTLELVPGGGATITGGQTTVEGFIDASDQK